MVNFKRKGHVQVMWNGIMNRSYMSNARAYQNVHLMVFVLINCSKKITTSNLIELHCIILDNMQVTYLKDYCNCVHDDDERHRLSYSVWPHLR